MVRYRRCIFCAVVAVLTCAGVACTQPSAEPDAASGSPTASAPSNPTDTSAASPPASGSAESTPSPASKAPATYVFPVQPSADAEYARAHHDYPAADVFAPCGAAVVAVTNGVVDEVNTVDAWDPAADDPSTRSGLLVSIVGDDDVRYYASHLAEVAAGVEAGARVRAGDLVGAVGNSGNARGIACHVHFGISPPTQPGDWEIRRGVVWPWPYLDAWRTGESKSPASEVGAWEDTNLGA